MMGSSVFLGGLWYDLSEPVGGIIRQNLFKNMNVLKTLKAMVFSMGLVVGL